MAKNHFDLTLRRWLAFAFVISLFTLALYGAVQQTMRQDANDPQIQLAEDGAHSLEAGASPDAILPSTINMGQSLAPFLMVFDAQGKLLASSAELNGQGPALPPDGVFDYTSRHGSERFSWQTSTGLREASVLVRTSDGRYVLAARSLAEVEKREDRLFAGVVLIWLVGLAGSWVLLDRFWPAA